ncbi:MAG: class I SAM-dependent methyltransferase [Candidatus Obscuribacterales bacterium]
MTTSAPSCPVCATTTFADFCNVDSPTDSIHVVSCSECGLLLSSIEQKAAAAEGYDRTDPDQYAASVSNLRIHQSERIVQTVRQWKQNGLWVDVGCSFGYLLQQAKAQGFSILGIEPDKTAFAGAAQLLGSENVINGLFDKDMVADGSAEIISMLDVLEHIPAEHINDMAELVRNKLMVRGLWVIKVPSTEGLYFIIAHALLRILPPLVLSAVKRLWQSEYRFPHTVYFSSRTLSQLLRKHNFEILSSGFLEEVPNKTIMARLRMDPTISIPQAMLMTPAFVAINTIERLRGKSDALVIIGMKV